MAVAFRPAGPGDVEAVHALRRDFYREDGSPWAEGPAREALRALLGAPALGRAWVAEDGGEAVGYVVLALGFSLEFHGRDAFVDELYVRPSHRRQGLGRAALAAAEAASLALGVRALHLEVDAGNEAAAALYRRWGFAPHARRLMTKWLAAEPDGPDRPDGPEAPRRREA